MTDKDMDAIIKSCHIEPFSGTLYHVSYKEQITKEYVENFEIIQPKGLNFHIEGFPVYTENPKKFLGDKYLNIHAISIEANTYVLSEDMQKAIGQKVNEYIEDIFLGIVTDASVGIEAELSKQCPFDTWIRHERIKRLKGEYDIIGATKDVHLITNSQIITNENTSLFYNGSEKKRKDEEKKER